MQTLKIGDFLKSKFVGTDELRRELRSILERLPKEKEVIVTQNGRPKGVLLDLNYYLELEELQEQIADSDPKFIKELNKALGEVKAGKAIPAEEVFKKLGI